MKWDVGAYFSMVKCSTPCTSTTRCRARSGATDLSILSMIPRREKRWVPRSMRKTSLRWRGSAAISANIYRRRSSGTWCTLRTGLGTSCWSSSTRRSQNQVGPFCFYTCQLAVTYCQCCRVNFPFFYVSYPFKKKFEPRVWAWRISSVLW